MEHACKPVQPGDGVRKLRHDILHLVLKPGTKISEQEVSERFQVSRTPVREVFVRLFQDGLVEIYPQRGTYVSLINLAHVDEGRFVREVLEMAVVREICGELTRDDIVHLESNLAQQEVCHENQSYLQMLSLDERFHATLFRIAEQERTWQMVSQLNNDFFRRGYCACRTTMTGMQLSPSTRLSSGG